MTIPYYIEEVAVRLGFGQSCKPSVGVWCVYRQSWTGTVRVGYLKRVEHGRVWGIFRNAEDMRGDNLQDIRDVELRRSYIFWPDTEAFFFEDCIRGAKTEGVILKAKCFSQFQQRILEVYT